MVDLRPLQVGVSNVGVATKRRPMLPWLHNNAESRQSRTGPFPVKCLRFDRTSVCDAPAVVMIGRGLRILRGKYKAKKTSALWF